MLTNYIKIAFRNLWKFKLFSFINILGLSIGISACLLITLFVIDELTYDRFNNNHERIYRLNSVYFAPSGVEKKFGSVSPAMADAYENQIPEIEKVIRLDGGAALVQSHTDIPISQRFLYADSELFEAFDFKIQSGSIETFKSDINSVLLDEDLAIKFFGETNPVGKSLAVKLDTVFTDLTVAGIVEKVPTNSSIQFQMVLPFDKFRQITHESRLTTWFDLHISAMIMVNKGASKEVVSQKIQEVFLKNIEEEQADLFSLQIQPLKDIHFGGISGGNGVENFANPTASWILCAVGFFMLLIACINFINLSLGMTMPRSKEIGLRKVVGAGKLQIMKQFLGESLVICILALAFAILLTDLFLPVFQQLTNKSFVLWSPDNWFLIVAATIVVIFITLLSGVYPATIVARFNPVKSLKEKQKLGGSSWLSKVLIVVQFAIGIIFLTGTFVIKRQMEYIRTFDKGYDDDGLISVTLPVENNLQVKSRFKEKLLEYPFIKNVTANTGSGWRTSLEFENNAYEINHDKVDHYYFQTLGVEIVSGRNFDKNKSSDQQDAIIVNEAFLEMLGLSDPIGQRIAFNYFEEMKDPQIIGVVEDFNYESLHAPIEPIVYYIHSDRELEQMFVKIDESKVTESVSLISSLWQQLVPKEPLTYEFVKDQNLRQYNTELRQAQIIQYSSLFAIVLSCLGLFGLASLHISQRKQEIGLRKVLGASKNEILVSLSKHFIYLVIVSIMIATPFSWWAANRWLETFTYKTELPLWLFFNAGLSLVVLAALSIAYQCFKTAQTNPIESIRTE